ncbi:MAG TPA: hypothetical protein VI457_12935 [Methylococcaceae bacterium]|nr:hypothetical protein [Methylococcaceae bacterium]
MMLIHKRLGIFSISVDKGAFGPKGNQHVAAIATTSKEDTSVRLILFRESTTSPISVLQSEAWDTGGRWSWLLAFKKGSLYLYGDGSCGAVCHSSASYQFQIRDGECRLVGVEESNVSADSHVKGDVVDQVFLVTTNKRINLLTKRVRYSRERCLSSDDNPWYCVSKANVSEREFSFMSDLKWRLQEFSPDIFDDFQQNIQYLHGRIDADLKFIESNP